MSKRTPRNTLKKFKIIRVGKTGQYVTTVLARDPEKALANHFKDHGVTSEHDRKRLMAIPEA